MTASLDEMRAAAFEALRRPDAARARDLLEQVIKGGAADAEIWLGFAQVLALQGDHSGRARAIDRALSISPHAISPLVAKGDMLTEAGDPRAAASFYAAALRHMPNFAKLPAPQQQELSRAKAANEKLAREFEEHIRARLDQDGLLGADAPQRFVQAVDILVGKRRPYLQEPRHFYFPELPQVQFYPPEMFDWIGDVEGAAPSILAELNSAIAQGEGFQPYLSRDGSRPQSNQMGLDDNPAWGAYFLIKDGAPTANAKACPRAMQMLAKVPTPTIPSRTPHALFSKLAAGTRIPPHTGMLNVRLICHLALIVPPSCMLRVGNQLRAWQQGKCLVFDDTIEHEAWNGSDQDRYVLIFDVWRPELSSDERVAVAALCAAVDSYGGAKQAWDA